MRASNIMTRNVISVTPETTLKEAVTRMLEYGLSGLPVVSAGALVGMITEGDLLRRSELGTEPHLSQWQQLVGGTQRQAINYVRTHGLRVGEVMSTQPIFVDPDASLRKIVALMEARHVKRLPVLSAGHLVGMVSRADLLRVLMAESARGFCANCDDEQTVRSIRAQIDREPWAPRAWVHVMVHDGVVELTGTVRHESERTALRVLAENTAGVKRVVDELIWIEPMSGAVVDLPKIVVDSPSMSVPVSTHGSVATEAKVPSWPNWNRSA
ncbi:MAG TPA: CBS domain-containing protein [Steroidobacteraceae bacterium]|jgi:CBS domain-containing protein|nr:CBS domain-containing protein [Steroidobacteraceae bacterium]